MRVEFRFVHDPAPSIPALLLTGFFWLCYQVVFAATGASRPVATDGAEIVTCYRTFADSGALITWGFPQGGELYVIAAVHHQSNQVWSLSRIKPSDYNPFCASRPSWQLIVFQCIDEGTVHLTRVAMTLIYQRRERFLNALKLRQPLPYRRQFS